MDCVRNLKPAGDFFVIVQDMYKFFSGSFVHAHFIKKQRELELSQQPIELKKLSVTRWSCQCYSLWVVQKTLPAIIATLKDIKSSQIHADRPTHGHCSHSLMLNSSSTFSCLRICSTQQSSCLTLQSPDLLLETATDLAHSVIASIKEKQMEDS